MKIVVSHLTRMEPGFVCVAGLDIRTGNHVRPVLGRRLSRDLLQTNGGVFDIGAVVDLGRTTSVGTAPEVEDHRFSVENLKLNRSMAAQEFWIAIQNSSSIDLATIFGPPLAARGGGCAVDMNSGTASLGCLQLPKRSVLEVDRYEKIRLRLNDGRFAPNLSVTDLRVYEDDQKTPRQEVVARLQNRSQNENVLLSVGLARAWKKPGDTDARHWLQVNNLHFESDPLGQSVFR